MTPEDTLILAKEKNKFSDDCYADRYPLSVSQLMSSLAVNSSDIENMFQGRSLASWAIFAAPRHPLILRTMQNIVDIIRREFLLESVITMNRYDMKWKICMCATGPAVLTASARQIVLEKDALLHGQNASRRLKLNSSMQTNLNFTFRIVARDFAQFRGNYKVFRGREANPFHYMHTMQVGARLIREYILHYFRC